MVVRTGGKAFTGCRWRCLGGEVGHVRGEAALAGVHLEDGRELLPAADRRRLCIYPNVAFLVVVKMLSKVVVKMLLTSSNKIWIPTMLTKQANEKMS